MELANGNYLARAVSAQLGMTKSGKEQVAVTFRLKMDLSKTITWYGYFTDKTTERTIESLRFCGWIGVDLTDLSGIDREEVELVIANEEYEGKTSPRVQWVNRVGGMMLSAPLQPDAAKAFAARMKGAVLAYDKKAGAPKPASKPANGQRQEPPPPSDADMPPDFT